MRLPSGCRPSRERFAQDPADCRVLLVIVWQLGAGLYYLLTDRGDSKRTVNALTRRIALSVALILLVILGIYSGWIKPHGL